MGKFINSFSDFGITLTGKANSQGNEHTTCPQCSPSRKKSKIGVLGVHADKGVWRCNHCGWAGHLMTQEEAEQYKYKFINDKVVLQTPTEDSKLQKYWTDRGISHEVVYKNNVKTAKTSMRDKSTGQFSDKTVMVFEYRRYGSLINRKYRDREKNFKLESGADLVFWGLDHVLSHSPDSTSLIITEGEPDKMSFNQAGHWNAVSVPNGTSITPEEKAYFDEHGKLPEEIKQINLSYLDKEIEFIISKYKTFYIATDSDAAGFKLRLELIRRLGKNDCKVIDFAKVGCKDANEVLMKKGVETLNNLLKFAKYMQPDFVITAKSTWGQLEQEYDNGKEKGALTGFKSLEKHMRWRMGDVVGINGYPSHGKTVCALNLMMLASLLYDWKWGIYSPENMPAKRLYDTLAEILVGNSSDRSQKSRMSKTQYYDAINDFIDSHFYVVDSEKIYTPQELRDIQDTMIKLYGIHGFLKDPWNSLKHRLSRSQTLDTYLEEELSQENLFAISRQVVTIINVHPPTPKDKREDNPPSPFEITGGKIWYAKLPLLTCVHRPNKGVNGVITHFHVQKVKFQDLVGIPTDEPIQFNFDRSAKRLREKDAKGKLVSPIQEQYDKLLIENNTEINF